MGLFKRNKDVDTSNEPVLAAVIPNAVSSEIYQDILKQNGIPCVWRQQGAGGYIKILTGGLLTADSIYVSEKNLEKAQELYKTYIESEDFSDGEDEI